MNAILLLLAAATTTGSDAEAALVDLAQFPPAQQPFIYYATTATTDAAQARESLEVAAKFVLPHVSRQRVLERCLPVQVTPTLYRMDLSQLGWDLNDWYAVLARYPYSPIGSKAPRVVRMDWLLIQLTDAEESGAYYEFVYGNRPKNRAEAFASFRVNADANFAITIPEGRSGVSVTGKRRLINFPSANRGDAWLTEDSLRVDAASDPLEQIQGSPRHDGEEAIFREEKVHAATGATGTFQYYALFNGQGTTVDKAPANLVVDHHNTRGTPEIVNGMDCMVCHTHGLQWYSQHELREYLDSGVELLADYKNRDRIEYSNLADADKLIRRANEDFAEIVELACGVKPEEAIEHFHGCVVRYDQDLTLDRAAAEVYMAPDEFQQAIALASARGYQLGARVSGLAHGKPIPRDSWEANYYITRQYVEQWRSGQ